MVVMGPMPGSTPISVPSRQPRRQAPRLVSVAAMPKPVPRLARTSMSKSAAPHAERLAEQDHEQQPADDRHGGGKCNRFERSHLLGGEARHRHDGDDGGDEAGALD